MNLLLLLSVLIALCALPITTKATSAEFIVLIDAGSSGSRVHVHQYVQKGDGVPVIEPSKTTKIKPGLSSYAANPSKAGDSLRELIVFAQKHIAPSQIGSTPVHLQGTAGLRLLTDKQIEAILEDVREELFDSPFIFEPTWAKVISGHQEGMNGWLATNYLLGSFDDKQQSSGHVDTIGVLEVGGASMQATFHSDKYTGDVNPDDADVVSLNGVDYTIYTHSYLDYGLDKAQEVVSMRNFKQIEESGNPCYNPGLRHSATGDFNACVELVKTMFPVDEACKWGSDGCSFNGISQPRIYDEPFYAIENFYYTTHFFGIEDSEHPMEDLRVKGKEFCSLSIEDAKAQHPNEPEYDLSKYCFSSAYLTTLVEYGLHFPSDEHVRIMKTINDNDIDWALGAVLYSLTQDPAEMALYRKEFVFLGCVGALLCLGAILFFYNKYHKGGIAYSSLAKSNRISFNV